MRARPTSAHAGPSRRPHRHPGLDPGSTFFSSRPTPPISSRASGSIASVSHVAPRRRRRERIARTALDEALGATIDEEGALRLLSRRARLTPAAQEKLEAGVTDLLATLDEADAPEVEILLYGLRRT